MLNPLAIASAVLTTAANLPGAIESIARSADLLERANAQAEELNRRGDVVLQELAEAREVFAAAMLKFDRGTNELVAARDQLRESRAILADANERIGRALEMAEPLDRMTTRAARIAGTLRRDPADDGG